MHWCPLRHQVLSKNSSKFEGSSLKNNEILVLGELTRTPEENQEAGGAQWAHAGTEHWLGVDSRCPPVNYTTHMSTKKLINNRFKKEIENFIRASLRIITWETAFQKALRTVLPVRGESRVI